MKNPILEPIIEENSNLSEEAVFQVYNDNYVRKKKSELSIKKTELSNNQGYCLKTYKLYIVLFFFVIIIIIYFLDYYNILR